MKKKIISLALALSIIPCAFAIEELNIQENFSDTLQSVTQKGNKLSAEEEKIIELKKFYKPVTKELKIIYALEAMKGTLGEFSRNAILSSNLTQKPVKVEFKNLGELREQYADFDALGWKKKKRLYIYINQKHIDAPPEAIAALLSHEALHQDEFDSLNEETYAWTMEAAVWNELTTKNPELERFPSALVTRENMLKKLFIKGNYTSKYIQKAVHNNRGYETLPSRSPGFEDENI